METQHIESCLAACQACVDTCETCSTENKGKEGMEHSVKLCLACKDVCNELITAIKNKADNLKELYKKCEEACTVCAIECEKHTHMQHCKICAEACRKCAAECKAMLASAK